MYDCNYHMYGIIIIIIGKKQSDEKVQNAKYLAVTSTTSCKLCVREWWNFSFDWIITRAIVCSALLMIDRVSDKSAELKLLT